jgi:hypothetical protein
MAEDLIQELEKTLEKEKNKKKKEALKDVSSHLQYVSLRLKEIQTK